MGTSFHEQPLPGAGISARYRVLVVDDNDMNRDMLRFRLEREGLEVVEAANGQDALGQLAVSEFHIVLLDVNMPVMGGPETLAAIKADDRLAHIPVVMLTAVDEDEMVKGCLEAGADDYLTKPFNPAFLKARVRSCLERVESRSQQSGQ